MATTEKWRAIAEIVGTVAVVLSLVYVGVQLNQNTRAIQAETSESMSSRLAGRLLVVVENPDVADLIMRARRFEAMTSADSLRYDYFLNLQINEYEAAVSHLVQGSLEEDMARSWLGGLPGWTCRPGARDYWRRSAESYVPAFRAVMDSVIAETSCSQN